MIAFEGLTSKSAKDYGGRSVYNPRSTYTSASEVRRWRCWTERTYAVPIGPTHDARCCSEGSEPETVSSSCGNGTNGCRDAKNPSRYNQASDVTGNTFRSVQTSSLNRPTYGPANETYASCDWSSSFSTSDNADEYHRNWTSCKDAGPRSSSSSPTPFLTYKARRYYWSCRDGNRRIVGTTCATSSSCSSNSCKPSTKGHSRGALVGSSSTTTGSHAFCNNPCRRHLVNTDCYTSRTWVGHPPNGLCGWERFTSPETSFRTSCGYTSNLRACHCRTGPFCSGSTVVYGSISATVWAKDFT